MILGVQVYRMCNFIGRCCILFSKCLVQLFRSLFCGAIQVDLMAKREHLNEISRSFYVHIKRDLGNSHADVTNGANGVSSLDIDFCAKTLHLPLITYM